MDNRDQEPLLEARQFARRLRSLSGALAPTHLAPTVFAQAVVGDWFFQTESPLGSIFVAYNRTGVGRVTLGNEPVLFADEFLGQFGRLSRFTTKPPQALADAVTRRLHGERAEIAFDLRELSEFEQATLMKALEIPRGEVRPYAWLAREIGRPRAVRAVGSALHNNPVPLLIPCHRIVRSDGAVGDYGFGPAAKRAVLMSEGLAPDDLDTLASAGIRYYGSDTTHIYCYPTCRYARRATAQHRVTFHSDAEAQAAGYRPCKVCRPA